MNLVDIATWNCGNGTPHDLAHIMAEADVIGLQEASDRDDLRKTAVANGWRVIDSDLTGAHATPVLVGPRCGIDKRMAREMLARQSIGPGVGPNRNKQKNAVGGRLHRTGAPMFGVVSTHLVPSSFRPLRRWAAKFHARRLLACFNWRPRPWFVCMDGNTKPDSTIWREMYAAGWTNSHREGKPLPTHGKRAIDYVFWKKSKRVEFVSHRTIETRSDHRALVVTVDIKPRRKHR